MDVKDDKLTIALNNFVDEMDEVLGQKESEGKIGWDDPKCKQYIFHQMIDDARALCHEQLTPDQKKKSTLILPIDV